MNLTGKQRRALRALGHHLQPAVTIGKNGVVESVLEQLEEILLAQQLVKVKLLRTCPLGKEAVIDALTQRTGAALAQAVGHTLLLYRPRPESPLIGL